MGSMAKVIEREKAIHLRQNGKSIKNIARELYVSKSSASLWCRDVKLTSAQIKKLHGDMIRGSYAGRIQGAKIQHEKRIERERRAEIIGIKKIGKLSKRDLLIALTALYWGEGSKKKRELFIVNSDPDMVRFLLRLFRELFGIRDDRFILGVGINIVHKNRDGEIKKYWSKVTGISAERFRKTIFTRVKNKKKYKNFGNYYGMLRINVSKSIDIYNEIMGLIKGLATG